MSNFFHAKTDKYMKRARFFAVALGIPFSMPVMLCFLSIMLEFRQYSKENFILIRVLIIASCIILWMLLSFAFYAIQKLKQSKVSRYTYFEILPSVMIFSCYAGSYKLYGNRTVRRKIYVIPISETEIRYDKINNKVVFKGKIRLYEGESSRMGYNIKRGKMEFENWWLNENGFVEITKLILPQNIMKQKTLYHSAVIAQKKLKLREEAEKQKKMAPQASYSVRKKPKKRVYTSIPTFNRNW